MKNRFFVAAKLGLLTILLSACATSPEGLISKPGIYQYGRGAEKRTAYVYDVREPFSNTVINSIPLDEDQNCRIFDVVEYAMLVCQ